MVSRYSREAGRGSSAQLNQSAWRLSRNNTGIQRRKTDVDEGEMDSYFTAGDVLSAEVQQFFADGSASLHTRSTKYRKLKNGQLIVVPSALIRRAKSHFLVLACGTSVILGVNGYIWISKHVQLTESQQSEEMYSNENDDISNNDRELISRVSNIISSIASLGLPISQEFIEICLNSTRDLKVKDLNEVDFQDIYAEMAPVSDNDQDHEMQ